MGKAGPHPLATSVITSFASFCGHSCEVIALPLPTSWQERVMTQGNNRPTSAGIKSYWIGISHISGPPARRIAETGVAILVRITIETSPFGVNFLRSFESRGVIVTA
jgi:hypothetical protein